jgi:hypothetical protein
MRRRVLRVVRWDSTAFSASRMPVPPVRSITRPVAEIRRIVCYANLARRHRHPEPLPVFLAHQGSINLRLEHCNASRVRATPFSPSPVRSPSINVKHVQPAHPLPNRHPAPPSSARRCHVRLEITRQPRMPRLHHAVRRARRVSTVPPEFCTSVPPEPSILFWVRAA